MLTQSMLKQIVPSFVKQWVAQKIPIFDAAAKAQEAIFSLSPSGYAKEMNAVARKEFHLDPGFAFPIFLYAADRQEFYRFLRKARHGESAAKGLIHYADKLYDVTSHPDTKKTGMFYMAFAATVG